MLLFGTSWRHVGDIFWTCIFHTTIKDYYRSNISDYWIASSDLVDKPLGIIIFSSTIANGRTIADTLLFSFILLLTGLYLYDKRGDIKVLTLASGSIFHLMEDQMWASPRTLFWPLLGWRFRKNPHHTGLKYLLLLFKRSFRQL